MNSIPGTTFKCILGGYRLVMSAVTPRGHESLSRRHSAFLSSHPRSPNIPGVPHDTPMAAGIAEAQTAPAAESHCSAAGGPEFPRGHVLQRVQERRQPSAPSPSQSVPGPGTCPGRQDYGKPPARGEAPQALDLLHPGAGACWSRGCLGMTWLFRAIPAKRAGCHLGLAGLAAYRRAGE